MFLQKVVHSPAPQLLWTVDQGSALDVSGVADAAMRERLIELLSSLPLRCTKKVWGGMEILPGSPLWPWQNDVCLI
jgi:hypothetical protein